MPPTQHYLWKVYILIPLRRCLLDLIEYTRRVFFFTSMFHANSEGIRETDYQEFCLSFYNMFMDEFEVGAIVASAPFHMSYGSGVKARTWTRRINPPILHLQKKPRCFICRKKPKKNGNDIRVRNHDIYEEDKKTSHCRKQETKKRDHW